MGEAKNTTKRGKKKANTQITKIMNKQRHYYQPYKNRIIREYYKQCMPTNQIT